MNKYFGNFVGSLGFELGDDVSALTRVAGSVCVRDGATLTAPALTGVSGSVCVREGATFTASALNHVSGSVHVEKGATFIARAITELSGSVYVEKGATPSAPALTADIFNEIADSDFVLFANSQFYKAGCRGPWDAKTSLSHWDRSDVRAVEFTLAIKKHETLKALS